MLNLHAPTASLIARLFRSVLLILIFIFYSPSYSLGQTIYDYALELDFLYKELKATNESAAKPFFDVFRKVADQDPYYPVEDIAKLLPQFGLYSEKEYALKLYDLSKRIGADSIDIFEQKRDSLANIVYGLMDISLAEVESVINYGGEFSYVIDFYGDLNSLPDSTYKKVIILMIKIEDIEDKIKTYQGQKSGDSGLAQKEEALNALPIGIESTSDIAAPIIIQNQVGGSAQSAIIDGTAKWIAERMRQELSIAFFDRFETWAENKNIILLFPNTISVLKSSATTDYTLMMEIYKRAFQNDLRQLTFNIPTFLEQEIIDEENNLRLYNQIAQLNAEIARRDLIIGYERYGYLDRDSSTKRLEAQKQSLQNQLNRQQFIKYLNLSLQTINQLQEGQHPSTLLNTLHKQSYDLFPQNDRLQSILLLLSSISQSLTATNKEKNTVWIGKEAINQLKSNAQLRKFYFGLLVLKVQTEIGKQQQRQSIITNNTIPNDQRKVIMNRVKDSRERYKDFQNFLGGGHPTQPTHYILDSIDNIVIDEYLNSVNDTLSTPPLSRAQLETYLYLFRYSPYYKFLKDAGKLRGEDYLLSIKLWEYTGGADGISTNHVWYFYAPPDPNDFFYHCQKESSFEAAKNAYFERTDYHDSLRNAILPEFNTEENLTFIDSINNIRLKNRYDFYQKYFKNRNINNPDNLRQSFEESIENDIIVKDSIAYTHQLNIDDPTYLKAALRMNQLGDQQQFLSSFIIGNHLTTIPEVSQLFNSFVQYANRIDQINAQFKELRSSGQANFGNQEFIYLLKNSMGVLDLIFDHTVDKSNPTMVRNMETIQFATDNLLNAYIAGLSEDYNGVITYIIPVVEKLVANKYDKLILPLEAEARAMASEDQHLTGLLPRSAALDSLRLLRDDKLRKMQEVFKYCTFIAAVAKSNGSDDVKKAINAIALPVGSYSIKRRTYANISLNAYPGITGGFELVQNDNFSEWAPNFGFTAPIGIGINWGYRTKINEKRYRNNLNYRNRVQKAEVGIDDRIFNGHSGSFFFSFVDLGALVLFRLNDSNEPLPEDVGFKQIFSPGVAYVHGLPRVPVSIMLGAQMTPDLRKIGEGENQESANSFRFNLSFVVDLPIANFHTRRRPKR